VSFDAARADRSEYSARVGYAAFGLDRQANWRGDAARIEALFSGAGSRCVVLAGGETPVLAGEAGALTVWHETARIRAAAPALAEVFLGTEGAGARMQGRFALAVAQETIAEGGPLSRLCTRDLRSIAIEGFLPPGELAALGAGKALVDWHLRHGFCARCGAATLPSQGGWRRDCPACGAQHFPRTDPVAIMLAVRGGHCLLARQSRFPPGMFSCLAGFIEPGETLEDAVRRKTLEEAGIRIGAVRYLAAQPWPFPSSLMIGCLAEAQDEALALDGDELEDGRWFSREEAVLMLRRQHPDGLFCPPRMAIANSLLRAWAVEGLTP
jgi:NAD+ diphosphatase